MAPSDDEAGKRRRPGRNQQLVFDALSHAERPLGAYDLLRLLKPEGLRAPPQIYRALECLIREGKAHKIETLGAYTLCAQPCCEENGGAFFTICRTCGRADELHDPALSRLLGKLSRRSRFKVEKAAVELSGLCDDCSHA
ncbi:Fur family transcriptional regulator [Mangrovicella endophytica]|uniref:Fur family transcriptional regulator n=1 Tax=Mangrovicella endophytica TaxID=2066697 RepID=UPI0012FFFF68|nr:transcriptional repressor [Mangrovicella endophytica]